MNLLFGSLLIGLTAGILYSFINDFEKDECQNDDRYETMLLPSWVLLGVVSTYGLLLLILTSVQCFKCLRACNRRNKESPEDLSSDEEDDVEFMKHF